MHTILIVEDDRSMRMTLRGILEAHDFLVMEAANGHRLMEILESHTMDLIVLDLYLPDGNGLDFLHQIRDQTNVPVLILSSDQDNDNKVIGLDCGADDYISKPFDPEVLMARIRANIRRFHSGAVRDGLEGAEDEDMTAVKFGQWLFDRAQFQIFDEDGVSGDLTLREFMLLGVLIEHAGRAIKRSDLCEYIRENQYIPTPRAIDVKIARVRKKIGDDASDPMFIKTVRGVGYMIEDGYIHKN